MMTKIRFIVGVGVVVFAWCSHQNSHFLVCFLRSALRRSPRPLLPPSVELWAQLGSLQPGSQLQSAPFVLLHHQHQHHQHRFQSQLRLPAGETPVRSHQPRPRPSSVSPRSSASEWIGGEETPASPPQPPHPSAGLGLWAGARARSKAGDRQPVHVALTRWVKHLHHLWQSHTRSCTHTDTPTQFHVGVWDSRRAHDANTTTADSWTWANKSLSDEYSKHTHTHTHTHSICLCWECVYQRQTLTTSTPSVHSECIFWEFYNSVDRDDYSHLIDVEVLCERGESHMCSCPRARAKKKKKNFKYLYSSEFIRGALDLTSLALKSELTGRHFLWNWLNQVLL